MGCGDCNTKMWAVKLTCRHSTDCLAQALAEHVSKEHTQVASRHHLLLLQCFTRRWLTTRFRPFV